jgi:hypothetical protein
MDTGFLIACLVWHLHDRFYATDTEVYAKAGGELIRMADECGIPWLKVAGILVIKPTEEVS